MEGRFAEASLQPANVPNRPAALCDARDCLVCTNAPEGSNAQRRPTALDISLAIPVFADRNLRLANSY